MGSRSRVPRLVVETVIGWLLVVAGLVMLVTPGPGIVTLLAGLAVLARHYRWADWLKARTLAQVHDSATRLRARRAAGRAIGVQDAPGPETATDDPGPDTEAAQGPEPDRPTAAA